MRATAPRAAAARRLRVVRRGWVSCVALSVLCGCGSRAVGAAVRPPWADPAQLPSGVPGKAVFVSSLQQHVRVLPRELRWSELRLRCDGVVTEDVEFDFSPERPEMLRPEYEENLPPEERVPHIAAASRQYYEPPGARVDVEGVSLSAGAEALTQWRAVAQPAGPLANRSMTLIMNFTPPTRGRVSFRIELRVRNFLESRTSLNLISWLPFGPDWEGPGGALVANGSFSFLIPFGNGQGDALTLSGDAKRRGYNVYTSIRQPPPTELWTETSLTLSVDLPIWASELGLNGSAAAVPPGKRPLRFDIAFDMQEDGCAQMPLWVYFAMAGAGAVALFCSLSLAAFLFFERPWQLLPCCGLDPWARRRRPSRQREAAQGSRPGEFHDLGSLPAG
eukprot:TRINITY_DN12862_c0_g1_i1.p1 TRINITY_DN12862_c0_g1~~TRINITY_DN12862_c0_g1_i1.p1  ORF type:complete len:391 (+),score=89.45 TRINITY_DN12862_c0_g1_i1:78-1250(+)